MIFKTYISEAKEIKVDRNEVKNVGFNGQLRHPWYITTKDGLKTTFSDVERFRYALKNDNNIDSNKVDKLIKELEK